MKKRTKVVLGVVAGVLLFGPFAIPVGTSGTLTNQEAAASSWQGKSQFERFAGLFNMGSNEHARMDVAPSQLNIAGFTDWN